MFRVLVCDPVAEEGLNILRQAGCDVLIKTNQNPDQLLGLVKDVDAIVVRSETRMTSALIAAAPKLRIIGRAGVGVDNIDVPAATSAGVVVVNSPEGNTVAAAEHTFAMLLSLARHIPQANQALREKRWDRKKYIGIQLYQKTLGVVGLGKIGRRVAGYARHFGMRVLAYDPFVPDDMMADMKFEKADLDRIFLESDFITLHVPKTDETQNLVSAQTLSKMKPGCRIINCARGGIIHEQDLLEAIERKHIAGAAIDVFDKEPNTESPLIFNPDVIATPHLGASTEEAQVLVAMDVAADIVRMLHGEPAQNAVNLPLLRPEIVRPVAAYLKLSEKLGLFVSQLFDEAATQVEVKYHGELATHDVSPLTLAFLKGFLTPHVGDRVNYVNASLIAKERGIALNEIRYEGPSDYVNLISVKAQGQRQSHTAAGTKSAVFGETIVNVDGFKLNALCEGLLLVVPNRDVPGMVAKIATYLGNKNINIAGMTVGRERIKGEARMILNVDDPVLKEDLDAIGRFENILGPLRQIKL